jgi:hypothetical protein
MGNDFYVVKSDTRIGGPWRDVRSTEYIPTNKRTMVPRQWQQDLIDVPPSDRIVNFLYDPIGNLGKSQFYWLCKDHGHVYEVNTSVPWKRCAQDLASAMSQRQDRSPFMVVCNFERATPLQTMGGYIRVCENVADQELVDTRNGHLTWHFEPTRIWVFSSKQVPEKYLSKDRVRHWQVVNDRLIIRK